MLQAQRVADFMRRKLAKPRQRHFQHLGRNGFALLVGSEQTFGDQIILAHPQRAQRYVPLDNFAGARIDHSRAIRPTRA